MPRLRGLEALNETIFVKIRVVRDNTNGYRMGWRPAFPGTPLCDEYLAVVEFDGLLWTSADCGRGLRCSAFSIH